MKRSLLGTRALALALGGALLGAGAWWFAHNFGFTTQREYVGFSGEARADPYFAARLLLTRMGLRVQRTLDMSRAHALAEGATLVLAAGREDIDPPTLDALLGWVERGGHLLVAVETAEEHDALLAAVRVQARWPREDQAPAQRPRPGSRAERFDPHEDDAEPEEVALKDGRRLRANFAHSPLLIDLQTDATRRRDSGEGAHLLAVDWGEGRVTLFSTLRPFNNANLGEFDHAELLWQIVATARSAELYLVRQVETASLPRWLLAHAPLACTSALVFLALWLWRVASRFGPLAPSPARARRSLLEHLHAVGRHYAHTRQQSRLLMLLREDCLALFARAAPLASGLEGAARLREASHLTRINARELLHAFSDAAASRNDFFHMVRTLARFRRRLTRAR